MTTAANSLGLPVRRRRGRWLLLGILLVGALLAAGAAWRHWRTPAVPPPAVALDGLDPQVARAFASARDEVLAAPRSGSAWGNYGMVLAANHYRVEALPCFAEAERLQPEEPRWPYLTATLLLPRDTAAGIGKLRQALALGPDNTEAIRLQLAQALFAHGDWEEAEQAFRQVLAADPQDPLAHLGLARLAWERGKDDECRAELRPCLDSPYTRKAAHNLLAQLHERRQETEAAAREARTAASLPEDLARPVAYLAEMEACQVGLRSLVIRAIDLSGKGREDEALQLLQQAVQEYSDRDYAWLLYGQALTKTRDLHAAEAALRRATALTPDLVEAHFQLGVVLYLRKDYAGAAAAFRRAAEVRPSFAWAHYNLGQSLKAQGKRDEAAEAFRAALRCRPDFAEARRGLEELAETGREPGGVLQPPEGSSPKALVPEQP
jgi:tetratricopeptide (TPR) repeat protein